MKYVLLFAAALFFATECEAQPDKTEGEKQLAYGAIGLGAVEPGFGGLAELTFAEDAFSLSAKGQGGGSINIFGSNESISWLSVSVGYQLLASPINARIALGPCYYWRSFDTAYLFGGGGHSEQNGYGANAEIDVILFHSKYFGLGAQLSAMLSRQKTFFGLTINVLAGK